MSNSGPFPLLTFLAAAARRLEAARGDLCALDGEVGDGDHGSSMADGMTAALRAAQGVAAASLPDQLQAAGSAFLDAVGATVGPLYASAFFAAARAAGTGPLTPARLIAAFAEGISLRGKAKPGDCTMIDAWAPAARAATEVAAAGGTPAAQAEAAFASATAGARATETMVASRGRAASLGTRAIGHPDPGARSALVILAALSEVLSEALAEAPPPAPDSPA